MRDGNLNWDPICSKLGKSTSYVFVFTSLERVEYGKHKILCWFVVLRPSQQLWSCQDGQLS